MKTLADEIMELLPRLNRHGGVAMLEFASALNASLPHIRAAFMVLKSEKRAIVIRRGKGGAYFLAGNDYPIPVCRVCHREFERKTKRKRLTCSRACACKLSWVHPGAGKRAEAIKIARNTPESRARASEANNRRWADPKQREKLSMQNRKRWADPEARACYGALARIRNGTPEARERIAEMRRKEWADPEIRAARLAAQNKSKKTQAYREKMRELAIERNRDPEFRAAGAERNRQRGADPVFKERMREFMKARWRDPVMRDLLLTAARKRKPRARHDGAKTAVACGDA